MNINDYQRAAARTSGANLDDWTDRDRWSNAALGLAGEAGEVVELVKKHLHHGRELDLDQLRAELGDLAWYLSECATLAGIDLADVLEGNVAKLRARYPDGFVEGGGVRDERRDLAWTESILTPGAWGYVKPALCPDVQSVILIVALDGEAAWTVYHHDDSIVEPVATDDAPALGDAFTAGIASAERHGILTPAEAKHARDTAPVDLPAETR